MVKLTPEEKAERKRIREEKLAETVKKKTAWDKKRKNIITLDKMMGLSNEDYLKNRAKVTFFTNQQVPPPLSNYCICIVKNYRERYATEYKEVLVDPGVHDLGKYGDYRYKDKIVKLLESTMPENVWTSLDYSTYFAKDEIMRDQFMEWTYENNLKYADHSQYICTVQVATRSFEDFHREWDKVKHIFYDRPEKMLAIGGEIISSYHSTSFTNSLFSFISQEHEHLHRIHFYGLSLGLIGDLKKVLKHKNLHITVDSTKWRFAGKPELLKLNDGLRITTAENINEFYSSYMREWEERLNCRFEH